MSSGITSWRTPRRLTADRWLELLRQYNSPMLAEWETTLAAAGDLSALMAAMAIEESQLATDFNLNKPENRNPLNLRPRGGDGYQRFADYTSCIKEWRSRITDPTYAYAGTTTVLDLVATFAPESDLNDPKQYATNILTRLARWGFDVKEMPMKIVATPCPIEIKIIPQTNRNRPGLAMPDPSYVTVHEVGNTSPGADEDMHEQFVRNGGGEHSVSFQGVCGPTKFIQLMPMNEAAWHASDGYYGRGNRDSFAIETIQIGDFNKTLNHLAWIVAEMFRNPRRFMFNTAIDMIDDLDSRLVKERTKQHNFWAPDKKNCPQFIRDRGLWPAFLDAVEKELNGRKSAFVAPVVPSWWSEQALLDLMPHVANGRTYTPLGTRLTALKTVVCYANGLDLGAGKTRANLVAGDVADVRYTYEDDAGREWGITRYGTHVRLTSFDPRIIVRKRELQAA